MTYFVHAARSAMLLCVAMACNGNSVQPQAIPVNTAPAAFPGTIAQQRFTFAGNGATYNYLVFTPTAWTARANMPALLLIHGAGGNGADMLSLWQSFADAHGIVVVAPTFPLDAQWEEFVPQLFPALMEQVRQSLHFDRARVYVFGYSAGSYSTFDAATLASSYFAAAGVFAGVITPGYDSMVTQAKRKSAIAIYIGDHDPFFTLAQTRRTRDLLVSNGFPVHYVEIPNQDHNYSAVSSYVNADAWAYVSGYSLP
ncbi:MAG: hypothetical protein M3R65_07780 [Gemmatimonadota bacterium]|nr:hypothetical protein [Gemmatimonadota bacterium]